MSDQTPDALVEAWRELAKDGTWADSTATRSWAAGLNRCANDLEAALALSREPMTLELRADDYSVIVEAVNEYLGFDITTREQQDRITTWATAASSAPPPQAGLTCEQALRAILEIGKRDMSNPKYDGYFDAARAALPRSDGPQASRSSASTEAPDDILARVANYFEHGGFFNPELMDPQKVKQLLMDLADEIRRLRVEHTRAILHYTAKGYAAGENTNAKHWRERAEKAEAALASPSPAPVAEPQQP
jgi:hypothetical protein